MSLNPYAMLNTFSIKQIRLRGNPNDQRVLTRKLVINSTFTKQFPASLVKLWSQPQKRDRE